MNEFMKYPKIYALGKQENEDIFANPEDEIVIQEKMDGANFRFMIKDGKVIFGSRSQQLTSDEGEETNVGKNFKRCLEFILNQLKDKNLSKSKHESRIFYGECMVKHTMSYDWDNIPPFLGFDVFSFERGSFYDIVTSMKIFKELDLPIVPLIEIKEAKLITSVSDNDVPTTVYPPKSNPKQQAEGIVFKNYKKQIFGKYVREQFKEENALTFGGTPKYEETDAGKIAARYVTNARIDKCIFKLIDEGHKLDLPLMKHLPQKVYDDILEEHWRSILTGNKIIDTRQLRKITTKRCLAVLKQVMVNNALGVKDESTHI